MKCPPIVPLRNAERAAAVESEHAAWIAAHASVPGAEVHVDADAAWMVQPGAVWSNAETRLNRILKRYRDTRRGVGFWLTPFATPADLPERLKARGFRCRKHYPAMYCDLRMNDRSRRRSRTSCSTCWKITASSHDVRIRT